jgi:hypothetical protein
MKTKDKTRITTAEIIFMKRTVKYTHTDCNRNEDIFRQLKTEPIVNKILKCITH